MRITKDPEERRLEIIKAAEMLFAEKGFENTAVSEIVKSIGVAQGTFYYYFKSKEDVFSAIAETAMEKLTEALRLIAEDSSLKVLEKIGKIIDDGFEFQIRKKDLVAYMHTRNNIELHDKVSRLFINQLVPSVTFIIEQGVKEGIFNLQYPRETVEFLMAGMQWLGDAHDYLTDNELYARKLGVIEQILQRVLGISDEQMDFFRKAFSEKLKVIMMI